MDDATLASLQAALAASPDNAPLRGLVLKAHLERAEVKEARALLGDRPPEHFSAPDRLHAARALLESGEPERVLLFCAQHPAAEAQLLMARALTALGRRDEARTAYQRGVALNPTLEDSGLLAQLTATVRELPPASAGGPRLRVISNDDTASEEVDRVLAPPQPPLTFADVGGLTDIKKQIRKRIILPFQKPSLFERFSKRAGGGILLYGPPGLRQDDARARHRGRVWRHVLQRGHLPTSSTCTSASQRAEAARALRQGPRSDAAVLFFDELEALAAKRQYTPRGHQRQAGEPVPHRDGRLRAEQRGGADPRRHQRAVGH